MNSNIPTTSPTRKPFIYPGYSATTADHSTTLWRQVSFDDVMRACDAAAQKARWRIAVEPATRRNHRRRDEHGRGPAPFQSIPIDDRSRFGRGICEITDLRFLELRSIPGNNPWTHSAHAGTRSTDSR